MTRAGNFSAVLGVALLIALSPVMAGDPPAKTPEIGAKISPVESLRDLRGNRRLLSDFQGRTLVVAFLGVDCPLANLYVPRLIELEAAWRDRGAQFLAVYSNEPESLDQIAAHAYQRDIPFPVLKDFGQQLADALGAKTTPTVCVLDAGLALRYRGRIDDQYGVATRRPRPASHELADALAAVIAGQPVPTPEAPADGCRFNRATTALRAEPIAFHRDVEPILQARCQECHRPGQIGPFELTSYESVVEHIEPIVDAVAQRRMPPWHADARYGRFRNERRLSDDELVTLLSWHKQQMPKGDTADAPPPREWTEGWRIDTPDLVLELPTEAKIPADGVLPYRYSFVSTGFNEDRWVRMAEARPGNAAVVHHIIVYTVSPGRASLSGNDTSQFLVGFAPGADPLVCPPDMAVRIPAKTDFVFEVHYTPNGTPAADRSSVGIVFADGPPQRELRVNMFGPERLSIPAHDQHHCDKYTWPLKRDAQLISLLPHMHWRGKAFRYELVRPDGSAEVLASVPRYDFNWQATYRFAEPVAIPRGASLRAVAHWDNSANNPANPDPSRTVPWGLQTSDEMMLGIVSYAYDEPAVAQLPPPKPLPTAAVTFRLWDRDQNGLVMPDELPADLRKLLEAQAIQFETGLSPVAVETLIVSMNDDQEPAAKSKSD